MRSCRRSPGAGQRWHFPPNRGRRSLRRRGRQPWRRGARPLLRWIRVRSAEPALTAEPAWSAAAYNAKNTLMKNYLYFAEKWGAEIRAEAEAHDVRPLPAGQPDGARYEVAYHSTTAWLSRPRRVVRGAQRGLLCRDAGHPQAALSLPGCHPLIARHLTPPG